MSPGEAVAVLARWLLLRLDAHPYAEQLPGLHAAEAFDACLLRWQGKDLRLDALLADPGGPPEFIAGRAEALRRGLESAARDVDGRVRAVVWTLCQSSDRAAFLRESLLDYVDGHFLSKVLVGRGVICLDDGSVAYAGRSAPQPAAADYAVALQQPDFADEDALRVAQARRLREERALRRLLGPGPAPLTWTLIALNIAAYGVQWGLARGLVVHHGLSPAEANYQAMLQLGANFRWELSRQPWRLLTAAFLHGGLLHLAMNMLALHNLGRIVERLAGPWRMAVFYLAAAVVSSFVSALFLAPGVPSLGASGALLGLAGLLLAPRWRPAPAFPALLGRRFYEWLARPLVLLFALGFALQALDLPLQFDNMAHLGGLLFGLLVGYLFPSFLMRQ